MGRISLELEAIKKIQKIYPAFEPDYTSLSSYKIMFNNACITYDIHSDKKDSLEILEAILLLKGTSLIEKMKGDDSYNIFISAVESRNLKIVDRLIELMQNSTTRSSIIHAKQDQAFRGAVINFDLKIINRLIEVTNDPDQLDKMIHAIDDFAFHHAIEHNRLPIVNRLIMSTSEPKQIEKMVNSNNGYAFFYAGTFCYLEIIQYLLSVMPISKPMVISEIIDDGFKQRVQDSDRFVQKLITLRNNSCEQSVMKVFDCLKYAKSVFNLVQASKSLIGELRNLGILEVLIDYLGDQDVSLTKNEKVRVLNALSTPGSNLENNRNSQDKKITFVERILTERAIKSNNILTTYIY